MKKIIALLIALIMMLTLLAGCGSTPAANNGPVDSVEIGQHTGVGNADAANPVVQKQAIGIDIDDDLSQYWLCQEKTTLTVMTYDGVNASYRAPSNDLWFWQLMEAYTNVHIEWEITPYSGYAEVINTRLSAGVDLADIVMNTGVRACQNAGDNGVFIDLAPYWDTCFTNTKAYMESGNMDLLAYITNPNGKIYAIPNVNNPTEGHITFIYNTEWLNKLGDKMPTTLDEFTALMYKWQQQGDMNGNGIKDEIYLTSPTISALMSGLGPAFNLEMYEGWEAYNADANGNVYAEYTTENMRTCLTYLNKLYEDGILDQEITYTNDDDMAEKVANDRVGCFVYYAGFAIGYGNLTAAGQADPMGEHYSLGMPLASQYNGNEGYFVRRTLAYGNTGAAITAECQNPELAAKWLDVLYADPNILWARVYGREGYTYQFGANGGVQLIATDKSGAWDPYAKYGIGQIALPQIQTTEEMTLDARAWWVNACNDMRNCKWVSASVPKVSIFTEEEAMLRDEVFSETDAYWFEWRDKFVTGMMDIETDWDTYVNSINGVGMKQLTQVWQMVYDRTKG